MTPGERPGTPPAADPAAVQAEVARLRAAVHGGRGPGAGRQEHLAATRWRRRIAGWPVPALREEVAVAAATARGDTGVLAQQVARDRARLATDLDLLLPRLGTRARVARSGAGRASRRAAAGTAVLVAVLVLLRRGRRG